MSTIGVVLEGFGVPQFWSGVIIPLPYSELSEKRPSLNNIIINVTEIVLTR